LREIIKLQECIEGGWPWNAVEFHQRLKKALSIQECKQYFILPLTGIFSRLSLPTHPVLNSAKKLNARSFWEWLTVVLPSEGADECYGDYFAVFIGLGSSEKWKEMMSDMYQVMTQDNFGHLTETRYNQFSQLAIAWLLENNKEFEASANLLQMLARKTGIMDRKLVNPAVQLIE